jgi:hypothetical protein
MNGWRACEKKATATPGPAPSSKQQVVWPPRLSMLRVRIALLFRRLLPSIPLSRVLAASLLTLLLLAGSPAQSQATNQRLILKDGTFQVVRQYQVVGDRVRYLSAERGEWEEMPSSLVDWAATEKWAKDHTPGQKSSPAASSPGSGEAGAIDKEEQAERAEQLSRTPQVMPGLLLPDEQGIWVLDTYQDQPELVELQQDSGDVNPRTGHNVERGALNSSGGTKRPIEMEGAAAKVQLHIDQPALFVSLSADDGAALEADSTALTVNTHGAAATPAQNSFSSPASQYAIVRVTSNFKHNFRVVGLIKTGAGGQVPQGDGTIPTKAEILPGKHWMKLTPREPLTIGEYALVEILSSGEVNLCVWDFRVDPQGPDNKEALLPLDRKP